MTPLLEQYKNHLTSQEQSLTKYNYIKRFLLFCESTGKDFTKITGTDIDEFFNKPNSKGTTYEKNSKNSFTTAGKDFYDFAKVAPNPWKERKYIAPPKREPDYLTIEQINKAITCLKTSYGHIYGTYKAEALLMFMFDTGVRREELLTLKRENVDLVEGTAKVLGKGDKERYVPISPETIEVLKTYFAIEPETINIFNIQLGKLKYLFEVILPKILGRPVKPHLMRHTSAATMISAGLDVTMVKEILGHSRLETTMIYTRSKNDKIQKTWKEKMKNIHKGAK